MARLTKRTIDALKPAPKDQFVWDDELPGFGLRLKSSGAKTFIVQYRNRLGRSRRLTLGRFGVLTAEEARKEARYVMASVAKGGDPAEVKKLERGAITIGELCKEYVAKAEAGLILSRQGTAKSLSTLYTDKSRIDRHIIPLIGKRTVKDLTPSDVRRCMQDIIAGRTKADIKTKARGRAIVTGGKGAAARTIGLLGGILSYAVQEGYRHDNPARGIVRPRDAERQWRLDAAGYRTLGDCLNSAELRGEHWQVIMALKALALTGCRRGEIERLEKSEVDASSSVLRLRNTKTGKSIRPIGEAALRILSDAMARSPNSKFVFPSIRDQTKPYAGLPKAVDRVVGDRLPGFSPHGLRHSFASTAEDLGYSLITIGALLGHSSAGVTAGYIHKVDTTLVAAANMVASHILNVVTGEPV